MAKPSITTRTAKGTPLTIAEMDSNLTNLKDGQIKVAVPGSRTQMYASGMISTSTAQKKFGDRSCEFNGSTNYFQINNMTGSSPWDIGMSSFTAEQFIYIDSTGTGERTIFDTRSMMAVNGLQVFIDGTGYLKARRGSTEIATSASPLSTNTWHHVAVERFTMGFGTYSSGLYLIVNGAVAGSWIDNTTMFDNASTINYGRDKDFTNYFKGFMDEIRWSKNQNRYMPNMPPYTTLNPAPTAELSSDYSTNYLFHCNDNNTLTDDYFTTMALDLNDTLKFGTSMGIGLTADTTNKQLNFTYTNSNSPAGYISKATGLTNSPYNGVLNFSSYVTQWGSGIMSMGGGGFSINNSSSMSFNYLIEVYGNNVTFGGLTGSPNLELFNTTDNMSATQETITNNNLPLIVYSLNVNMNTTKNFVIRINGASGSETMTGTAYLKITKIIT